MKAQALMTKAFFSLLCIFGFAATAWSAPMCPQAHSTKAINKKKPNVFTKKIKALEEQGDVEMFQAHQVLLHLESPGSGLSPFEVSLVRTTLTSVRDYQMAATGMGPQDVDPVGQMVRAFTASKHLSALSGEQMVEAIEKILQTSPMGANEMQVKALLYKTLLRYERISDASVRRDVSQYLEHIERMTNLIQDRQKILAVLQFDKNMTTIEEYRSLLFHLPAAIQVRLKIPETELRKIAELGQAYNRAGIKGVSYGTEGQEQTLFQFRQFLATNPYFSLISNEVKAGLVPHLPEMQTSENAVLVIGQALAAGDRTLNNMVTLYTLLSQIRHQMDVGFTMEAAPSGLRH